MKTILEVGEKEIESLRARAARSLAKGVITSEEYKKIESYLLSIIELIEKKKEENERRS